MNRKYKIRYCLAPLFVIFFSVSIPAFGQETKTTVENTADNKKNSYSLIIEFGGSAGAFLEGRYPYNEHLSYFSWDLPLTFINGISFNKKQDMVGIGIGCEFYYNMFLWTFPIFANYRHYFQSKTNLKPLINIATGIQLSFFMTAGLYSTISAGFKYKAFSFTSGIFIKSEYSIEHFSGGVEIKVGYTFNSKK